MGVKCGYQIDDIQADVFLALSAKRLKFEVIFSYEKAPCGIMQALQSFIPLAVYVQFPPQCSPSAQSGQQQNKQLNVSAFAPEWQGKNSQLLF